MSSSEAGSHAFNADVLVNGERLDIKPPKTSAQQEYLDVIAEQAEASVAAVKKQIAGLQASLKDREAEAKQARAEAQDGVN